MSKYGGHVASLTTTTSVITAMMVWGVSNKRAEVVEAFMTGAGLVAAADVQHQASMCMASTTLVGVGTTTTPEQFSQGSAVATSCLTTTFTNEPTTYDAVFPVAFGFNTRGGQRWAVPQGEGIRVDSGATQNRLGWRARGQAAASIDASMNWWED